MSDFYPRTPDEVDQHQAAQVAAFDGLDERVAWGIMLQWFREFWGWWMLELKSALSGAEGVG